MDKVRKKLIREKAVIAVYQYLLTQATDEEIDTYLENEKVFNQDKNEYKMCKELIQNTIDYIDQSKELLIPHLKKGWTIDRLSKMELAILFTAVYELQSYDKKIVINEAVELAKKYCDEDSYKFINGVLNNIG